MTLINNERDMKKLLDDLRVGEFSAIDLHDIALALPVNVLAAALYAHSGRETFVRAKTHEQKADVIARLLHAWLLNPDWRFGQLVGNICANGVDAYFIEDGALAARADALAGVVTIKPP